MNTQGANATQPAAHTPTPWLEHGNRIIAASGKPICALAKRVNEASDEWEHLSKENEANAALIVRAVNSHASLVAINAELVAALETVPKLLVKSVTPTHSAIIRMCTEVLARAEAMKKEGGL